MCEFQSIIDFSVQLNKFVNIDLFARGFYQIRLSMKLVNCKLPYKIEIIGQDTTAFSFCNISSSPSITSLTSSSPDAPKTDVVLKDTLSNITFPSHILPDSVISKTLQILYKNEEIQLDDIFTFRVNLCLDTADFMKQFQKISFQLITELWFNDKDYMIDATTGFEWVSYRNLLLHFDFYRGIDYNLPVLFDYYHLSSVTLTIHGSLVTICQPYINNKSNSTMWLSNYLKSEYKGDKRSAGRNSNGENTLKKANLNLLQVQRLEGIQWQLISLIISSFLTLKRKANEFYRILPPWQQAKIKFESMFVEVNLDDLTELTKVCFTKIDKVENFFNLPKSLADFQKEYFKCHTTKDEKLRADVLANSIGQDIAYLCGITIDQWNRFCLLVNNSDRINQHLAKIHHMQRIKRFSEGFFCIEQPRPSLFGVCDQKSTMFFEVTELVRKSAYFNLLPPCDVECAPVDGVSSTMPIIFEEKYESNPNQHHSLQLDNKRYPNNSKSEDFHLSKCSSSSIASPKKKISSSSSSSSSTSSSSSCSSSGSTKSNLRKLLSKMSYRTGKKMNLMANGISQDERKQIKLLAEVKISPFDIFEFYKSELSSLQENTNGNNLENINDKVKILNNLLNRKEILANYNELTVKYSDNQLCQIEKQQHILLINLLQTSVPTKNMLFNIPALSQSDSSRSWPNLFKLEPLIISSCNDFTYSDSHHKSDGLLGEDNFHLKKPSKLIKPTLKKRKSSEDLDKKSLLMNINKNFPGTVYFPRPPKEFTIDEPMEEVSLKPIPVSIKVTESEEICLDTDTTTLGDITLNDSSTNDNFENTEPIKASISCQDLLKSVDHHKYSDTNSLRLATTNLSYHKSNSFNESKLTFVELLHSDHCLICCGSIKNRLDGSWPCVCKKNSHQKKKTISSSVDSSPPTISRIATVGTDLISFLHAKETCRANLEKISKKTKNFLFYSDFHSHSIASQVPYFQCEPEFKAFSSHKDLHFVVCVHGLEGNCADLRLIRTYLELGLPMNNFEFLMSQRNQGETFDSLERLTSRLVHEIENYVSTYDLKPTKLSFIGHSLGNIIIRAAISRQDFRRRWQDKFHTFLSLSGPHLGLGYNPSGLINMGLWVIQKFKKAVSLNQLSMKDSPNIRQTYLYKLSTKPGLEYFRNILLCGSSQDYYVPIHSAHIELCNSMCIDNSENGAAYREMANNILERLDRNTDVNILRYDVHHALPNNANTLIGRAAHIAVLDSELFIEKFMVVVGLKYFM